MDHFVHDLRATFAARAGHEAVVYKDGSFNFEHVDRLARSWGSILQAAGVEPGDRVAIVTPERPRFLMAHLGAMFAGAVSLPLNPRMTRDELRYFLEDSGARAVVCGDEERPTIDSLQSELAELRTVLTDSLPADISPSGFREPAIDRNAPAFLLYSSGTTGQPKGVVHTQANLASSLKALRACWRITPDDVVVNVLPLCSTFTASRSQPISACWLAAACGSEDVFHPRRTLEAVGQGTVFMAIPDLLLRLSRPPRVPLAARGWRERPPLHLRLRSDPAPRRCPSWRRSWPPGHQPLRNDRGSCHHEPAA